MRTKLILLCLITLFLLGLYGAIEIVHARQNERFNLAQYPDVQKLLEKQIEKEPVRRKLTGLIDEALQKKCNAKYGYDCLGKEVTENNKIKGIRDAIFFATSKFTGAELGRYADMYMNRKLVSQKQINQVETEISNRFSIQDLMDLHDALESGK